MAGKKKKRADLNPPLLPWEKDCCFEFLRHGNKTWAYTSTYPKAPRMTGKGLNTAASRFFCRAEIKLFVAELKLEEEKNCEVKREHVVSRERILQERARLAFFNFSKLFDKNGLRIPLANLPDEVSACVSQYDEEETVITKQGGETSTKRRVRLKFIDKNPSLGALEKIYHLYEFKPNEEDAANDKSIPELLPEMTEVIEEVVDFSEGLEIPVDAETDTESTN